MQAGAAVFARADSGADFDLFHNVFIRLCDAFNNEGVFGLARADAVDHELDRIDAVEKKIEGVFPDRQGAGTELTKHVLGFVRDIAYPRKSHHGC